MPDPHQREEVQLGRTMPAQDLRLPLKHALLDLSTDLKTECDASDVSYNAATKAQSGDHPVSNKDVQTLFQRLLHDWKPGTFAPARGQMDQLVGDHMGSTEDDRPDDYKDEAEQLDPESDVDLA